MYTVSPSGSFQWGSGFSESLLRRGDRKGERGFATCRQNEGSLGRTATARFKVKHEDYVLGIWWGINRNNNLVSLFCHQL